MAANRKRKSISAFGIEFTSISELTELLGYKSKFSYNFILNQYGSIEGLVRARLGYDSDVTDAKVKEKLLSLKERKTNPLSEDALNQQHSRASRLAVQLIKAGVNKIISERDAMETLALLNGLKLTDDIAKNILSAIKTYSETLDSHALVETLDKIKD
ncbi:hypothetical protein [Succinatimonas hippei]|uniref:Uncharacterized protein n=1 Tax=Succinatimonas hippei (strain DSM 22608 / JCM 16073 / KCTC 15190 / YIT 12066) TaxID=762983 RepID=E8LJA5_SUCHY|nr:hypothetical protein [Succinatimonas hippei]EFY07435.1 hypothetical protein HMPREF9444_00804 [Succinatimonas hippei YIT 12066]MCL1603162.1 hypothetical protein [Succinatimonas hippei]